MLFHVYSGSLTVTQQNIALEYAILNQNKLEIRNREAKKKEIKNNKSLECIVVGFLPCQRRDNRRRKKKLDEYAFNWQMYTIIQTNTANSAQNDEPRISAGLSPFGLDLVFDLRRLCMINKHQD